MQLSNGKVGTASCQRKLFQSNWNVVRSIVSPEQGNHRIINGDNLSVMTSLLAEFRGGRNKGIDVIYFDPPYNTGNDVFSYNDDYRFTPAEVRALKRKVKQTEKAVSLDDPSRHTKWINHIAPRLWAARKLLKSTGVIILSIDEHELPRLWMLMEEMFGEKNRIATLIWERSRKNDASYISEGHEYMLVWARNKVDLDAKRNYLSKMTDWSMYKGKWRKRKDVLRSFSWTPSLCIHRASEGAIKSEKANPCQPCQPNRVQIFLPLERARANAVRSRRRSSPRSCCRC